MSLLIGSILFSVFLGSLVFDALTDDDDDNSGGEPTASGEPGEGEGGAGGGTPLNPGGGESPVPAGPTTGASGGSGTPGPDVFEGTDARDQFFGAGGDDVIRGNANFDNLGGGGGEDQISGGPGKDVLDGGTGDDSVSGGEWDDALLGGPGNDRLEGDSGDDVMLGEEGNDTMFGGPGEDVLIGGPGIDVMRGGGGDDAIFGFELYSAELEPSDFTKIRDSGEIQDVFQSAKVTDSAELFDDGSADVLEGNAGDDLLGLGDGDIGFGGGGNDIFGVLIDNQDGATPVIADYNGTQDELVLFVEDIESAGEVTVTADGGDAIINLDGQVVARVSGAAGSIDAGDVSLVELTPAAAA